jgi:hypothetical protein
MRLGDPEMALTPCPACVCAEVFTAVAPPGEREMPLSVAGADVSGTTWPISTPIADTATPLCRFLPIINFFFKRSPAGWHL